MDDPIETLLEARSAFVDPDNGVTLDGEKDARALADAIAPFAAPGFTVSMEGGALSQSNAGVGGLEEVWADFLKPFGSMRIEPGEMRLSPDGSTVVEFVSLVAMPHGVSAEIDQPAAAVWRLADGLLQSVEFHLDRDEALRAGGLKTG